MSVEESGIDFTQVSVPAEYLGFREVLNRRLMDSPRYLRDVENYVRRQVEQHAEENDYAFGDLHLTWTLDVRATGFKRPEGIEKSEFQAAVDTALERSQPTVYVITIEQPREP